MFGTRGIAVAACGIFYWVLCVFSIVTGLRYLRKGNVVNPLELPKKMAARMDDPEYMRKTSVFFGWLTFWVGVVQGLTAWSVMFGGSPWNYRLALGFTVFSLISAGSKLLMTFNIFPILKEAAYLAILAVLLLRRSIWFG